MAVFVMVVRWRPSCQFFTSPSRPQWLVKTPDLGEEPAFKFHAVACCRNRNDRLVEALVKVSRIRSWILTMPLPLRIVTSQNKLCFGFSLSSPSGTWELWVTRCPSFDSCRGSRFTTMHEICYLVRRFQAVTLRASPMAGIHVTSRIRNNGPDPHITSSSQCNRSLSDPPIHRSGCLRCPAVSSCTRNMDGAWILRANSAQSHWISMTTAGNPGRRIVSGRRRFA